MPKTNENYENKRRKIQKKEEEQYMHPEAEPDVEVTPEEPEEPQGTCHTFYSEGELMAALGGDDEVNGENIYDKLPRMWNNILLNGLPIEVKKKLKEKYCVPKNCGLLEAPKLNSEISALMTNQHKQRDKRIYDQQSQLGLAISAIAKAITLLMNNTLEVPELVRYLSDGCKLLNDIHFDNTTLRIKLVKNNLDANYLRIIEKQERDVFLFGADLGEKIIFYNNSLSQTSAQREHTLHYQEDHPGPSRPPKTTDTSPYQEVNSDKYLRPELGSGYQVDQYARSHLPKPRTCYQTVSQPQCASDYQEDTTVSFHRSEPRSRPQKVQQAHSPQHEPRFGYQDSQPGPSHELAPRSRAAKIQLAQSRQPDPSFDQEDQTDSDCQEDQPKSRSQKVQVGESRQFKSSSDGSHSQKVQVSRSQNKAANSSRQPAARSIRHQK